MKRIRQGLVCLLCIYMAFASMVGCAHFHHVIFITEACIVPIKGTNYRTCASMRVSIDGTLFTIPKNFKTDLATIPRILWPILSPQYAGFVAPAILHDYLYRSDSIVTRRFADEVLFSALMSEQVTLFTASKFYLAVRLFGASNFNHGECL